MSLLDSGFSKGQQQLLNLAAAILRKKDRMNGVLVLDEATSSVDRDTEGLMIRVIGEEFRDWTVIAVAHRLETIRGFERVVFIDRELVMEIGELGELLEMGREGWFGRLWGAQLKGVSAQL